MLFFIGSAASGKAFGSAASWMHWMHWMQMKVLVEAAEGKAPYL